MSVMSSRFVSTWMPFWLHFQKITQITGEKKKKIRVSNYSFHWDAAEISCGKSSMWSIKIKWNVLIPSIVHFLKLDRNTFHQSLLNRSPISLVQSSKCLLINLQTIFEFVYAPKNYFLLNRKNYACTNLKTDCRVSGFLYANHVIKDRAEEVNIL